METILLKRFLIYYYKVFGLSLLLLGLDPLLPLPAAHHISSLLKAVLLLARQQDPLHVPGQDDHDQMPEAHDRQDLRRGGDRGACSHLRDVAGLQRGLWQGRGQQEAELQDQAEEPLCEGLSVHF